MKEFKSLTELRIAMARQIKAENERYLRFLRFKRDCRLLDFFKHAFFSTFFFLKEKLLIFLNIKNFIRTGQLTIFAYENSSHFEVNKQ